VLIFCAVAEKTAKDGSGMLYFATPCSVDKHINCKFVICANACVYMTRLYYVVTVCWLESLHQFIVDHVCLYVYRTFAAILCATVFIYHAVGQCVLMQPSNKVIDYACCINYYSIIMCIVSCLWC